MIKANVMGAITTVFEKEFVGKDIDSIFNNDTYFYSNLLIEDVEVNMRMSNGETVKLKVIDWDVKQPDILIEDIIHKRECEEGSL